MERGLSRNELLEKAHELSIPYRWKMNKSELEEAIFESEQNGDNMNRRSSDSRSQRAGRQPRNELGRFMSQNGSRNGQGGRGNENNYSRINPNYDDEEYEYYDSDGKYRRKKYPYYRERIYSHVPSSCKFENGDDKNGNGNEENGNVEYYEYKKIIKNKSKK